MRLEDQRGQCRGKGQGDHERDEGGRGDGERELFVELACNAAHERGGHEDGDEHQGDANERASNLVHGDVSGLARAEPRTDMALHVFYDDDGIVDHYADGKYEAEHR